jgi:hypothetical protein
MESKNPASVAGAAIGILMMLSMIFIAGTIGCSRGPDLSFSSSTPATPEELLTELKDHQQKIDKATEDMLHRIDQFNQTRKSGERTIQFAEIFSQDFTDQQKEILNQMIAAEKDVSYKSILQQIVSDRDTIQGLQEKVMRLEQALPDSFVVAKKGDRHHNLAMNYLLNDAKVDEAKAKALLKEVDQTDELVAGNKVWFFYDPQRDTFRTYVTQGEAGQTPLAVRRAMKKQLITERDQAATARDEAVRTVNDLQQVKSTLESDISVLQQNKAALESSVDRLSSDLAFRQNSLFYHAANTRELKDQGVLSTVLKRVQDVKPVNYDSALDLRQTNTITLAPSSFGLERIVKVRMLPNIFQEGRDFKVETSEDSGVAKITILDTDLFKGKEVLFAVGG